MSSFSVRIELHHASQADYDQLHERMAARGFSRRVTSGDGVTYQLPNGMYNIATAGTVHEVHNAAFEVAVSIDLTCEVFAEQSAGRVWRGLRRVQPAQAKRVPLRPRPGLSMAAILRRKMNRGR